MALQMNVSGLRRNLKNIAHNYTDAQVKVREATSNDPWGPSSTLMSEIADLTYNVVAFSEIMQMIWKRLNDHGRNWRHVYKALVLLEYLIKTGSEKVADQCKENIYAIQTLKDFQYLEENKDMGMNVREKAKSLVALLKDDERLRNERVRALKAKERFAQTISGIGSDSDYNSPTSPSYQDTYATTDSKGERERTTSHPRLGSELETARPQTVGEEELQLQLAIAMSKEEAEQEEAKKRSDDVRLQMALNESEQEFRQKELSVRDDRSAMNDLLDINFNSNGDPLPSVMSPPSSVDPWGFPAAAASASSHLSPQHNSDVKLSDPWASSGSAPAARVTSPPVSDDPWSTRKSPEPSKSVSADPWAPATSKQEEEEEEDYLNDPWTPIPLESAVPNRNEDPFAPITAKSSMPNGEEVDEFARLSSREKPMKNGVNTFDMSALDQNMADARPKSKSPAAFLGENSNLVNLDNLISASKPVSSHLGGKASSGYTDLNTLMHNKLNLSPAGSMNKSKSTVSLNTEQCDALNIVQASSNCCSPTVPLSSVWEAPKAVAGNLVCLGSPPDYDHTLPSGNPYAPPVVNPDAPSPSIAGLNPFSSPSYGPTNPFQAQQTPRPTMNQMRTVGGTGVPNNQAWGNEVSPLSAVRSNTASENPFLM